MKQYQFQKVLVLMCLCAHFHLLFADTGLVYTIINDNEVSVSGKSSVLKGDVNIPATTTINGKVYKVTEVAYNGFKSHLAIKSVVLPSGLKVIRGRAFWGCTGLTSIVLPSTLQSIGDEVFYGCGSLKNATCYAKNPPTVGINCFVSMKKATLKVPEASVSDYRSSAWKNGFAITGFAYTSIEGITISDASIVFTQLGETKHLSVEISPEDATDKTITWTSSDTSVCTISDDGTITAVGYGTATITVTSVDGEFTATCVIYVVRPVILTALSYTRQYGDANPVFEYSLEGAELTGVPEITCEATAMSPVGEYPIVISKGSVTNKGDSYVNGILTITKAPLTISGGTYTMKQGEELPVFAACYDGFKNEETEDVLITKPTLTTTATSASELGDYEVTVSGAEAQNYEISYVPGTLTITVSDGISLTSDSSPEGEGKWYTLNGQKLNGKPTQKGVYIQSGKKVVIK